LLIDYSFCPGKIYNRAEIEEKKLELEFRRKYKAFYLGKRGNLFSRTRIDNCSQIGEQPKAISI